MPESPAVSPAKPAAAPSPAPAPSKPAAAPSAAPSTSSSGGDDGFAALDSKARSKPQAKETPAAAPDPNKPAASATPDPKDRQIKEPPALRAELDRTKADLQKSSSEMASLQARIAEAEKRGNDTTVLTERLATIEKERDDLRGQVRMLRRETSDDFKAKYEKPFNESAEFARSVVEGLSVVDDQGNPARPAKWDDFVALYQLPYAKAIQQAKAIFGDASQVVLSHMSELQKLDFQKKNALAEEHKNFKAREEAEQAENIKTRQFIETSWPAVNQEIANRNPESFQEDPNDPEGNELLKEGYKLVDNEIANRGKKTLQQQMVSDANIRHRAASYSRMEHRWHRAKERIADLEAEIAQYKNGGPGKTQRPGGEPSAATPEESWETDLRKSGAVE